MIRIFFIIYFVMILSFGVSCSSPKQSFQEIVSHSLNSDNPTLVFVSTPTFLSYKKMQAMCDEEKVKKVIRDFHYIEMDNSENSFFNELLCTTASNYFLIIEKGVIVSVIPQMSSSSMFYDRLLNYQKYPFDKSLRYVSVLGRNSLASMGINIILDTQYRWANNEILLDEYKKRLMESVKKFPYFYNRYLLALVDNSVNLSWLDSLNYVEKKLYPSYIRELFLKRNNVLNKIADIQFEVQTQNKKKVEKGDTVTFVFHFTNLSDNPAVIYDVRTFCGCTSVQWPRKPIRKGAKDSVCVNFTRNVTGFFHQQVEVLGNSKSSQIPLVISGEVL